MDWDWKKVKTEYITDEASSYTRLSKKYGISRSTIANRAGREGWAGEKERYQDELVTKTLSKMSNDSVRKAARIQTVADKLLAKIEKAVDALPDGDWATKEFRQISASLKDIKDIQMIKSDADMREQEARIASLQRQAEKDEGDSGAAIVIDGVPEEFKV